jgi:hypothetical protein
MEQNFTHETKNVKKSSSGGIRGAATDTRGHGELDVVSVPPVMLSLVWVCF